MDLSGLSSVTTQVQLTAWIAANCITPIRPSMTGSDFAAILQKNIEVSATVKPLNKVAGNISGTDPDFYIDLSGDSSVPVFPAAMTVYVSTDGTDAAFAPLAPVNYNPVTKRLSGMNDPAAFPSQKIKIFTI